MEMTFNIIYADAYFHVSVFFVLLNKMRRWNMEATREKANELRRRYQREWRRKNKEKVAEYNHNYWMKKAKELEGEKHDAKK